MLNRNSLDESANNKKQRSSSRIFIDPTNKYSLVVQVNFIELQSIIQQVISDQLAKPIEKNSSKYWVKGTNNQSDQKTGLIKNRTEMWKYHFSKIHSAGQDGMFNQTTAA